MRTSMDPRLMMSGAGAQTGLSQPGPAPAAPAPYQEHEFEAARGLPEALPKGEHILWQGVPQVNMLARRAFHLQPLALYFAVILAARGATVLWNSGSAVEALVAVLWLAPAVLIALALIYGLAWLTARTTVYTLTDKRIVMRIGIVLSVTFNLPLRSIESAGLMCYASGEGDIPLTLSRGDRIAWLHLWPHARPWKVAHPEPMLRCISDAQHVAVLIGQAWSVARGMPLSPVAHDTAHDTARSGAASQAPKGPPAERVRFDRPSPLQAAR